MRSLLSQALHISQQAALDDSLIPIATEARPITEQGHTFLLHVATDWQHRKRAAGQRPKGDNPFLPPEDNLVVSEINADHLCILNKFPVLQPHLLLISRAFEAQETPLTLANFAAAAKMMAQLDYQGLMFYNAGLIAGASQRHRHLQWVPQAQCLPDPADGPLPFTHYCLPLDDWQPDTLFATYQHALQQAGWQAGYAYNLLLTQRQLWLIPRSQSDWQGISINSLGFAGSFFVRDEQEAAQLVAQGFLNALTAVSGWPTNT